MIEIIGDDLSAPSVCLLVDILQAVRSSRTRASCHTCVNRYQLGVNEAKLY